MALKKISEKFRPLISGPD